MWCLFLFLLTMEIDEQMNQWFTSKFLVDFEKLADNSWIVKSCLWRYLTEQNNSFQVDQVFQWWLWRLPESFKTKTIFDLILLFFFYMNDVYHEIFPEEQTVNVVFLCEGSQAFRNCCDQSCVTLMDSCCVPTICRHIHQWYSASFGFFSRIFIRSPCYVILSTDQT